MLTADNDQASQHINTATSEIVVLNEQLVDFLSNFKTWLVPPTTNQVEFNTDKNPYKRRKLAGTTISPPDLQRILSHLPYVGIRDIVITLTNNHADDAFQSNQIPTISMQQSPKSNSTVPFIQLSHLPSTKRFLQSGYLQLDSMFNIQQSVLISQEFVQDLFEQSDPRQTFGQLNGLTLMTIVNGRNKPSTANLWWWCSMLGLNMLNLPDRLIHSNTLDTFLEICIVLKAGLYSNQTTDGLNWKMCDYTDSPILKARFKQLIINWLKTRLISRSWDDLVSLVRLIKGGDLEPVFHESKSLTDVLLDPLKSYNYSLQQLLMRANNLFAMTDFTKQLLVHYYKLPLIAISGLSAKRERLIAKIIIEHDGQPASRLANKFGMLILPKRRRRYSSLSRNAVRSGSLRGFKVVTRKKVEKYIFENYLDYNNYIERGLMTSSGTLPSLSSLSYPSLDNIQTLTPEYMSKFSDTELISSLRCFVYYNSRNDLLNKLTRLASRPGFFRPTLQEKGYKMVIRNTETTFLTDIFEIEDIPVAYGTLTNYKVYELVELNAAFEILDSDQRPIDIYQQYLNSNSNQPYLSHRFRAREHSSSQIIPLFRSTSQDQFDLIPLQIVPRNRNTVSGTTPEIITQGATNTTLGLTNTTLELTNATLRLNDTTLGPSNTSVMSHSEAEDIQTYQLRLILRQITNDIIIQNLLHNITNHPEHHEPNIILAQYPTFMNPQSIHEEFTDEELLELMDLLCCYHQTKCVPEQTNHLINQLVHKINRGLYLRKKLGLVSISKLSQFYHWCQKDMDLISEWLITLFETGCYMRRWAGPGYPYPLDQSETLGQLVDDQPPGLNDFNHQISGLDPGILPEDMIEAGSDQMPYLVNTMKGLKKLYSIKSVMNKDVSDWLESLPAYRIIRGSLSLYNRNMCRCIDIVVDDVHSVEACLRINSNTFIGSAHFYLLKWYPDLAPQINMVQLDNIQ